LRQVLIILFTNALEAMPEGGKIEVVLSVDRENKTCTLSVADEGSGVREEELDQIFQPFYTTKSSGGGTGLGLSIADTIIVKHNGRIVPLINTHGGMTFTVCLPSGIAIDSSGKS